MRRELDITKHDLARANVDTLRVEERCKMLERSLKDTRDMLRAKEAEIERLRRDRDRDRAVVQQAAAERALSMRRASDAALQYTPQQSRNNSPSPTPHKGPRHASSLDTRMNSADLARQINDRARMRSNETYMTRSDTWSGAQVLQAVHDINAEILQFAASATELCTYASFSPSAPHSQPALNDTVSRLGTAMTQILATRDHSSDPLLVQLALQGAVNLCLSRALASFIPGFPSKSDALLTNIYSEMRRCEPQPTSARWAALTSGYVHRLYPTLMEYAVGELAETMVRWCADVFLVARCMSSANVHQSLLQSLRSSHLPALTHVARSALALSKLTREEIMSTTFQVGEMTDAFAEYYPETPTHGASSHHKAQNMDRGRVVATIELGLRCVTRVAAPIPTSPDVDTHTTFETRLLLLPKVVLEGVVDVLDR
ncbi:hypothetical protein BJ165DRAFT_1353216 [Panaeolus papilionaceus]|nr:hypothetical protein BJ165DRAFT_1353216 [Panaeolus papilionaceus]